MVGFLLVPVFTSLKRAPPMQKPTWKIPEDELEPSCFSHVASCQSHLNIKLDCGAQVLQHAIAVPEKSGMAHVPRETGMRATDKILRESASLWSVCRRLDIVGRSLIRFVLACRSTRDSRCQVSS